MLNFHQYKGKKSRVIDHEIDTKNFLPYEHHWNTTTIITKNDWLLKVIKLNGFSFETADDEDVDIRKAMRNQIFKSMASGSIGLYFHIIRRSQDIFSNEFGNEYLDNYFIDELNEKWRKTQEQKVGFINELYITVIRKSDTKGIAILAHLINKFKQRASKGAWEESMKEAHEELEEATTRLLTSFRDYGARVLTVKHTKYGVASEIMGFLSSILNGSFKESIMIDPLLTIAEQLATSRTCFSGKTIEVFTPQEKKYAGIISVKEYSQHTSANMLDGFLQIPHEFIMSQSFQFINRQIAIGKMQLQQNRMIQTEDKAISQVAEISKAIDDATSGRVGFGEHHMTVMCFEKSLRALESAMSLVDVEMANTGIYPSRERVNMEPVFWGQMPCNFDFIVRKSVINTLNLASFSSQHNYPVGKKHDNHWGDAVTVFNTTSGTPFFFSFHVRDVGHTTIIGPTGAGKTVLMNFLCAQSIKFKPRIFFFDKDRGAEIFIRAIGGIYTVIQNRKESGLNPLQLDDTPDNRTFLMEWLQTLVTVNGEKIDAGDIATLSDAIDGNFKLKKEDRCLKNLAPFLGIGGSDSLSGRIAMWHSDGSHSTMFDNPIDEIDFNKSSFFGFEMGQVLKDKAALSPVLLYIFHRINISLDGTPSMIILDEAWALIDNPVFAPKIKDWLKVLRKLNTMVVFATQSVEDASDSAISGTLIQQTATQIFLPNLKATQAYRTSFMLSQREFILIKTTDPSSRFFLVKQGINAVIAKLDLTGMDEAITVLSGRSETVILLDTIRKDVGNDPAVWLPIFFQKVADA
ncbi:VirB4 family type IV secretion/conjugal transfer ATPase [Candidatus Xenohaliotis californiensis]|uniref:VirB4 family type IV secretion/conjugal transfer ATPase n=1 Tax=Candidatus Xenohaliotis californiensis TaxID=84677 RepID=UPI003977A468